MVTKLKKKVAKYISSQINASSLTGKSQKCLTIFKNIVNFLFNNHEILRQKVLRETKTKYQACRKCDSYEPTEGLDDMSDCQQWEQKNQDQQRSTYQLPEQGRTYQKVNVEHIWNSVRVKTYKYEKTTLYWKDR